MYNVIVSKQCDRDIKQMKKRGKKLHKLKDIVALLSAKRRLPPNNCLHKLKGFSDHVYECHIEPDWLLIWRIENNDLILLRTGTHSDLF